MGAAAVTILAWGALCVTVVAVILAGLLAAAMGRIRQLGQAHRALQRQLTGAHREAAQAHMRAVHLEAALGRALADPAWARMRADIAHIEEGDL